MDKKQYKVAICQESVIQGGRFRVVLGLIEALNSLGIEPDLLSFRLRIKPNEVEKIYGRTFRANFYELPHPPLPNDYSILLFNRLLSRFTSGYDLIINTSNSLAFLPRHKKALSYVFFPRESRIQSRAFSVHNPERRLNAFSLEGVSRKLLRMIYKFGKVQPAHQIVAMTEFTKSTLQEQYPLLDSARLPIVYPPVEIQNFLSEYGGKRNRAIVTIGRFDEEKRQIEQIHLAAQIPEISFHIMGFVGDQKYFNQCKALIEELGLQNVCLYPNAPHDQMVDILQNSKYFLHTLINEPFGITAVQAIAAGCLPIVHDSGGQREVVPYAELRYRQMSEIRQMINDLERKEEPLLAQLHANLLKRAQDNYDEDVFTRKIKPILLARLV
ncbi:MAG: glycosyltransferase [Anaerolineales bacterium]|nr:glycosyltransferase [Anaerolineales bacterium]